MTTDPTDLWNHRSSATKEDALIARSDQSVPPAAIEALTKHLRRLRDRAAYSLERIPPNSRVFVIEGISGSGKDTFQAYLKNQLAGREIYDFSEGELLHSWKHTPIEGILKLRIQFIKLFVN